MSRQQTLISFLADRLRAELPGESAHHEMTTMGRYRRSPRPGSATPAGVLALLYPRNDRWHLVYIERQYRDGDDRHSGQISFPGGRMEEIDDSLVDTALREAEEEIGLDRRRVEVLGTLTELYIPVSNFLVLPVVGMTDHTPTFLPEPSEVRGIIEAPLGHLLNRKNRRRTDIALRDELVIHNVPYFDLEGKVLWGATAMMTNELLAILSEAPESPRVDPRHSG